MDILIRKAEASDVPAIADLLRSLNFFAYINAEAPQSTQERVARHFAQCAADDSHMILVALGTDGAVQTQDGAIQIPDGAGQTPGRAVAGYSAVHWLPYMMLAGPEGYVSELFVREECRGQGIGRRLLEAIKAEAQQRGCSRLTLLNMRKRESYQRQFYAKQGWEERDAANFILHLG